MYTQSGEPVTISMIKKLFRFFKSLRIITFLTDIVLFLLAAIILIMVSVSVERSNLYEERIKEIEEYCEELSRKIFSNAYLANSGEDTAINREMSIVADRYAGRIIIVDSGLRCISDTYNIDTGKTLISKAMINTVKNNPAELRDEKSGKLEIYYPINSIEDAGSGSLSGAILFVSSTDSIYENADKLAKTLILVAIPLFTVVFLFSLFHSKIIVKPVKKITRELNHISAGYVNDKIEIRDMTEFEEMSEAFNDMIGRLNSLENSRQEFVSNVSHELKTPLTSIKILADSLVMQPDAPPEVYREFLQDINSEIDRENRIITDLLELVKLDRKNGEMHIAMVSVNELLEILMKRLKPIAQTHNIELVYESFRKVDAEIDEVKMMLAISNLVENAIKYNKDAGWVKVTLDCDHKAFTVIVSDSGIGIPEDSIGMIFDRFYRVDKMRARKTGGTGLGLSITKSVVLMHNGQIRVESKEGEGTIFTIRIPLSFVEKKEDE